MVGIVYKAENKINGKIYIGKTTQTFSNRKSAHKMGAIRGKYNSAFHNAIRKHGWDNFEWSILCECEDNEKLNALEKFYIAAYRKMGVCYNMTDGGEGTCGAKFIFTDEHKKNISKGLSGKKISEETRQKLRKINLGKKLSEETKIKISEGNKGKTIPEELRKKASERMKGTTIPVETRIKISNSLKGKKPSEETRKKLSEVKMGHPVSDKVRETSSRVHKGKKLSQETIDKIKKARAKQIFSEESQKKKSESLKRYWENRRLNK